MRATALSICFVLALLLLAADVGFACTCVVTTASEYYQRADAVFSGRVIGVENEGDNLKVTFELDRTWKPVDSGVVAVLSEGEEDDSCYLEFKWGEPWVIYARRGDDKLLHTGMCTGSALYAHAGEQLNDLRSKASHPMPRRAEIADKVSSTARASNVTEVGLLAAIIILVLCGIGFTLKRFDKGQPNNGMHPTPRHDVSHDS